MIISNIYLENQVKFLSFEKNEMAKVKILNKEILLFKNKFDS